MLAYSYLCTSIMKKYIVIMAVVAGLTACDNGRQQKMEEFRQKVRTQFLEEKLEKAQQELAHTDSMLQAREASKDSINAPKRSYKASLEMAADVQGAQIRYIHKKQKEMQ